MVVCGVELDAADERISRQEATGGFSVDESDDHGDELVFPQDADTRSGGEDFDESGLLKCLQIDLRKFGLGTKAFSTPATF